MNSLLAISGNMRWVHKRNVVALARGQSAAMTSDLDQPVAVQGLGHDRGRRDDAPGQRCDTGKPRFVSAWDASRK
jgi:hypothetical protein